MKYKIMMFVVILLALAFGVSGLENTTIDDFSDNSINLSLWDFELSVISPERSAIEDDDSIKILADAKNTNTLKTVRFFGHR